MVRPVVKNHARLAGHSHWQNVKNVKEAKDKIKNDNIRIISLLVRNALKEGNNIRDPKLNSRLSSAIERAKSMQIPMANIEKMLLKSETVDPYIIEFQAPGGIFFLAESCSKQVTKEKQQLQAITKKFGFKPASGNVVSQFFKHKADVICKPDPMNLANEDQALELALEVGAEEVKQDTDKETGDVIYKFSCHPYHIKKVQDALIVKSVVVEYSEDYYEPIKKIPVDEETKALMVEMTNKIFDQIDTVQRVFVNTAS